MLPTLAVLVPLSILAGVGWLNWREVWADARADMVRGAVSAAEYGQRALESYSLAAGRVNDRLRGLSDAAIKADAPALQLHLRTIATELTQSEMAYVIDRRGEPLLASNMDEPPPSGVLVADRDYFQALSSPDTPDVYVSRTFLGRFDGRLLFSVARRRRDTGNPVPPDGFDGVVLISVGPHNLAEGLRRLLPAQSDRMALVGTDRYGRSTTSGLLDLGQPLPQVPPESPFSVLAAQGVRSAVYMSNTATPGRRDLLAMQLIDGYPIYAISLRPEPEIIGRWQRIMLPQLAFALPATLALFLLSLRVWRQQRQLAASNADLRRDNDLSADRLLRANRFGMVGTFEADPRNGRGSRSPEYMWVHGLPPVATEETHDDWLARVHPDDRARAARVLDEALADPAVTDYAQSYRIVTPAGELRWIAARGAITRDGAGRAVMLLGAHVDVTPLRATEAALAESDARLRLAQEAVGIGVWELIGGAGSLRLSSKMMSMLGLGPAEGMLSLRQALALVHAEDRAQLGSWLDEARRSGGVSGELRVVRRGAAGPDDTVWLAIRATLVRSHRLGKRSLMGIAYEVTEQKRSEEMTLLMAREVEHRAKNALAVVLSLLRMTRTDNAEHLAQVMEGRVRALSQTMGLLGRGHWRGADLRDILLSELEPFQRLGEDGEPVIGLDGPPIMIDVDAAQPLSMALHELTTNAAKYGALSVPGGRLSVTWRLADEQVQLTWRERGGPPVPGPPARSGFGSRLIAMLFEGQLDGTLAKSWESRGLACEMSFPVASKHARAERETQAAAQAAAASPADA